MDKCATLALFGITFIFLMTSLGALFACVFKSNIIKRWNCAISGLAAGIMIAVAVWSLIIPSVEQSKKLVGDFYIFPPVIGLLSGGGVMLVFALLLPENEVGDDMSSFKRFYLAITAHNIPEGVAVGFALGSCITDYNELLAAMGVAVAIGIQNFPEGVAVTLPARQLMGRKRAFTLGVLSGAVEPLGGVLGFFAVRAVEGVLPYMMSFAAGAMIFSVITDVLPDALKKQKISTGIGVLLGFLVMMTLDIVLG